MYSSIKKKTCKCGCGKYPTLGCSGFNYNCMPEEIKARVGEKKDLQRKAANARKYANTKLRMDNYKENTELELWFRRIALEIERSPYCWETGDYISAKDYRSATSHIFPKAIFKSISTHPMNFLVLSPRNGSHDKTHRIDTFSQMKVFPIAIERFYLFEKEITEQHKYLDLFKEAIKNYK